AMVENFILVRTNRLRNLLRLARDLALELDATVGSKDEGLVEVQLLHTVEALERELPDDVRSEWRVSPAHRGWP
ncbi:MAG: hypothetical protein ACM3ZE_20610, partial [Myxococcales bacterium]